MITYIHGWPNRTVPWLIPPQWGDLGVSQRHAGVCHRPVPSGPWQMNFTPEGSVHGFVPPLGVYTTSHAHGRRRRGVCASVGCYIAWGLHQCSRRGVCATVGRLQDVQFKCRDFDARGEVFVPPPGIHRQFVPLNSRQGVCATVGQHCLYARRLVTPEDLNMCLNVCRFMTPEDLNMCLNVCCFMTPEDLNMMPQRVSFYDTGGLKHSQRGSCNNLWRLCAGERRRARTLRTEHQRMSRTFPDTCGLSKLTHGPAEAFAGVLCKRVGLWACLCNGGMPPYL
ncbi:hypothetical protein Taro_016055 [Colocasia esculenta]|uniref:Uncharacterized protein n=1 Tax=Colocasia esculenta TaxID=4460 RepID=A0A843UJ98_COLES|nr:hypothetical protein [Colocasia esculenta]